MTMQISCTYNDTVQNSPENVLTLEKAEKVNLTSAFLITRNTDDSLLLYKTCFQARHERDRTGKTHLYGYSVLFYGGYGEPLFLCWQSTLVGCSLFDFSATQHMCLVCARIRIMKRLRGMTYLMQRDKKVLPIIVNQSFGVARTALTSVLLLGVCKTLEVCGIELTLALLLATGDLDGIKCTLTCSWLILHIIKRVLGSFFEN
ncbi:hypothetical protein BY458DRAFT_486824 [Sporodiniella umbellata]|nr:hypothetical protein BY458DRAFT_486824 [Sporodiniella umbellata]